MGGVTSTIVIGVEDLLIKREWSLDSGWKIAKRPGLDEFLYYLSQVKKQKTNRTMK